jgi:membrane fusion protein (multidrug efflux system)
MKMVGCLVLALAGFACSSKQGGGGFSMPPMPVEVAPVAVENVRDKLDVVGTIEAAEAVTIVSEIDAAVKSIPFEEGAAIRRGDLIIQLDDEQLAGELSRAQALHAQSSENYERVKKIVEQKAAAPQDLDDAGAALKVAEANLAVAKARYSKAHITAPFDGVIGARRVSVGTFLRAGQTVTELANLDQIRVNFSAPERYLSRLTRGAEVVVSTTAYPGYELKGTIIAVEPILDIATRNIRCVAKLANPGRKLRSGMSANVSAILGERPKAITIPNESVFATGDQSFVFSVKPDSTVTRVPVTLGSRTALNVEVLRGLSAGMTIVRAGHQKLFEGAKVIPVNSAASATAPKE